MLDTFLFIARFNLSLPPLAYGMNELITRGRIAITATSVINFTPRRLVLLLSLVPYNTRSLLRWICEPRQNALFPRVPTQP